MPAPARISAQRRRRKEEKGEEEGSPEGRPPRRKRRLAAKEAPAEERPVARRPRRTKRKNGGTQEAALDQGPAGRRPGVRPSTVGRHRSFQYSSEAAGHTAAVYIQRSVSLSSMRRLRRKASSVSPDRPAGIRQSPAATRRSAGNAVLDQIAHDRRCARADDNSQFDGKCALLIGCLSVWPSTSQDPVDVVGDLAAISFKPLGHAGRAAARRRAELALPGGKQHFGLEDEAVADDADVAPVAQGLAQLAEEFRAVARQLLDLAGERLVEALAEIGDLGVAGPWPWRRTHRAPQRSAPARP